MRTRSQDVVPRTCVRPDSHRQYLVSRGADSRRYAEPQERRFLKTPLILERPRILPKLSVLRTPYVYWLSLTSPVRFYLIFFSTPGCQPNRKLGYRDQLRR